AQNASLPIGRFAKLDATFSALPNGPVSEPSTRIDIAADMDASGVALADAALATAVGDTLKLTFRASAARDGATDVHTAQLSTPTVKAEYTGQLGTQDAMGTLQVNAADLSRFGDIASLALRGSLKANAEVKGLLSKGPTSASLN
ncbi:hypothetical protein HI113_45215, partial [Corallococcus exiguus]|uniref:hypothetical protein n=1 Tax=Corallococcus exiguus TaxID=83462 RepID=UPI0014742563